MSLVWRIVVAGALGALAYILAILGADLLASMNVPLTDTLAHWLRQFALVLAVIVAILVFAKGSTWPFGSGPGNAA